MAAACDHLEPRMRHELGQDAPVEHGDDGIVVSGHHERRMVDERQPRKVGPPAHRVELRGIPLQRRRADQSRVGLLRQQLGLAPDPPAVERRRDLAEVRGRVVPVRRRQRQHRARPAGETPEPRDSRAPWRRARACGHDPGTGVPAVARAHRRRRRRARRPPRSRARRRGGRRPRAAHAARETPARRLPDTGRVEADRLDAGPVERSLERLPPLDIAADAHHEQQRLPLAADGGADMYRVDVEEADAPVTRRCRAHLVTPYAVVISPSL